MASSPQQRGSLGPRPMDANQRQSASPWPKIAGPRSRAGPWYIGTVAAPWTDARHGSRGSQQPKAIAALSSALLKACSTPFRLRACPTARGVLFRLHRDRPAPPYGASPSAPPDLDLRCFAPQLVRFRGDRGNRDNRGLMMRDQASHERAAYWPAEGPSGPRHAALGGMTGYITYHHGHLGSSRHHLRPTS
ncbi:hypothetical protein BDY21DRAFT_412133 [Lineolata rhizophorae]|uniref:Uncharacterized protein n=1 Tax=Lineolata rhizophorae TaxID=578093 RepID=A0A6A6P350_9PEZI|nr:hypothetical protein BDY21DRAFT_412133 [Lineolata rhizophorae]